MFYKSIVRSKPEYAAPVYATSLTKCLIDKLERIHKKSHVYHLSQNAIHRSTLKCRIGNPTAKANSNIGEIFQKHYSK